MTWWFDDGWFLFDDAIFKRWCNFQTFGKHESKFSFVLMNLKHEFDFWIRKLWTFRKLFWTERKMILKNVSAHNRHQILDNCQSRNLQATARWCSLECFGFLITSTIFLVFRTTAQLQHQINKMQYLNVQRWKLKYFQTVKLWKWVDFENWLLTN